VTKHFELSRDPDDEPYLNLAIESGAQFLVTLDRDLLDLMNWNTDEGRDFQSRYPNLTILDPVSFMKELRVD
jgi:predicted nucleic acid-binding protein